MHGSPTARTEDFPQYVFIHMDLGLWGWARMCTSARGRGRWRPQAQAATVLSQDAGANIVKGEESDTSCENIQKLEKMKL
jgi:hypothetical protein